MPAPELAPARLDTELHSPPVRPSFRRARNSGAPLIFWYGPIDGGEESTAGWCRYRVVVARLE